MSIPVDAEGLVTYHPRFEFNKVLAQPKAEEEASRILEVDDHADRLEDFTETLDAAPDRAARQDLTAEVLEQDPGAFASWFTPSLAMELQEDGRLSPLQLSMLAETYAAAFNNGDVPSEIRPRDMNNVQSGWQDNPDQQRTFYAGLDDPILDYYGSGYNDSLQRAEQVDDLTDFLNYSAGPEVAEFRSGYANHLLQNYVLNEGFEGEHGGSGREAAAGVAAELLGGDPLRPGLVTDTLTELTPEQRAEFLDFAADSKNLFAYEALLPQTKYDEDQARALSQPDAIATIYNAVARDGSPEGEQLAVEFARYVQSQPDWFTDGTADRGFDNYNYEDRANSVTQLFASHSEVILNELTEYVDERAAEDGSKKQYEINARDLAAVLELTIFNPDTKSYLVERARNGLIDYANTQATAVNDAQDRPNSEGAQEPSNRLVVLGAATDEAVDRGYEALAADRQASKDTIAFLVDLALVAVPLPKTVTANTSSAVAELISNDFAREAITGINGKVIDETTGRLTAEAKEQLFNNLDNDAELADLSERGKLADALRETLYGMVDDEIVRQSIQNDGNGLADDI